MDIGTTPSPRLDVCSGRGECDFAGTDLGDCPGDDPRDVDNVFAPVDA